MDGPELTLTLRTFLLAQNERRVKRKWLVLGEEDSREGKEMGQERLMKERRQRGGQCEEGGRKREEEGGTGASEMERGRGRKTRWLIDD